MTDRHLALLGFVVGVVGYCATEFASGHHVAFTRTVVAVAVGVAVACVLAALTRHGWSARGLHSISRPAEVAGIPTRVGTFGPGAFVAGVVRPAIYCDEQLVERLPAHQLRAVVLHEQGHQQARDPLRLVLLNVIAPLLRLSATGRAWLAWVAAQREIRADQHALSHGVTRSSLAAALVSVGTVGEPGLAGFASAIDLRLQALLGEPAELDADRRVLGTTVLFAGVAAGASTCAWVLHTVIAAAIGRLL